MSGFQQWLQGQLDARGWSGAELARRAKISRPHVSRILTGENKPGLESVEGIARALGIPTESVMREAGYLPDHGDLLPELAALGARLRALSPEQREAALAALEAALRVAEAGDRGRRAR